MTSLGEKQSFVLPFWKNIYGPFIAVTSRLHKHAFDFLKIMPGIITVNALPQESFLYYRIWKKPGIEKGSNYSNEPCL